jgi:HK97 family phage major capsid protein
MDWEEMLAEAQKNFDAAKVILSNKDATAEDVAKVEPLLEDAKAMKTRAMQLKGVLEQALETATAQSVKEQQPEPERKARDQAAPWKNWGEFLYKAWRAQNKNMADPDPRLVWFEEKDNASGHEGKDLAENVGSTGGFLVPTEFDANLRAVMAEQSIVQPRATVIPMRRRQIDLPVLDQTGTTADSPHFFGGMTFTWGEEGASKDETNPAFRKCSLVAHKLVGYTRASDELLDDSAISLGAFLSGPLGFAGGVAWSRDYAFLRGTGAGQPLGVINAGATINVNPAAGDVTYADLIAMLEAFLPSGNGVWVIHQSNMSNLMTMTGPAGQPSYLWGSAADGVPNRLLGYPVIWTEKLPRNKLLGTILLADFRYYLIGDRQATTVDSTQYERWRYDQTSWRVVDRCDGQPWLSAPLTLADGTSQVSPFVILGAKTT